MATAEQTVSAVLEATNKAYIVETGDSEDGLSHYRRWSDGTIEQWGVILVWINTNTEFRVDLPIEFSNTNYTANITGTIIEAWGWTGSINKETTGFGVYIFGNQNSDGVQGFSWQAIGK